MSYGQNKSLQGPCASCGQMIRYPAHLVGTQGACPLCGQTTTFQLEAPEVESGLPRRTLIWTVAAVLILIAGLVAAMIALNSAKNLKDSRPAVAAPAQK